MAEEGGGVTGILHVLGLHKREGRSSVAHAVKCECEELPNVDGNNSDEGSHRGWATPPPDVPEGCLAVYVGQEEEHRRFVIPATYLTSPVFKVLLEKVEEEFGFDNRGVLTFPCEVETFKYILQCTKIGPARLGP